MNKFENIDIAKLNEFNKANNTHFDEENHWYFVGNKPIKSVSAILKEKGISPDYSFVDKEVLQKASLRGTAIHLQVEEALRYDDLNECEDEALEIVNYIKSQAKDGCISLEQQVYSLNELEPYGGRYDILIENKDNQVVLYDIKTYKSWSSQKELQVKWQLSLYAYAIESCGAGKIDKIAVLRFDDEKKLSCQELKQLDRLAIIDLLKNKELSKEVYPLSVTQVKTFLDILKKEDELNILEEQVKSLKDKICEYMTDKDILRAVSLDKSLEITLVKGGNVKSLDSVRLKKDEPELFEKYQKNSVRKNYIKIKRLENV